MAWKFSSEFLEVCIKKKRQIKGKKKKCLSWHGMVSNCVISDCVEASPYGSSFLNLLIELSDIVQQFFRDTSSQNTSASSTSFCVSHHQSKRQLTECHFGPCTKQSHMWVDRQGFLEYRCLVAYSLSINKGPCEILHDSLTAWVSYLSLRAACLYTYKQRSWSRSIT